MSHNNDKQSALKLIRDYLRDLVAEDAELVYDRTFPTMTYVKWNDGPMVVTVACESIDAKHVIKEIRVRNEHGHAIFVGDSATANTYALTAIGSMGLQMAVGAVFAKDRANRRRDENMMNLLKGFTNDDE